MAVRKDLHEKYSRFVAEYNAGTDTRLLCRKYRIPEDKFSSFLAFLKRRGYNLDRPPAAPEEAEADSFPAHEIDYEIKGADTQFVEVELDLGETAIAEAGAMMYMEQGIDMETIFGDGSAESQGVMGRIFGAGKRVLTGESLFMTAFTNTRGGKARVAFAAPFPGRVVPMDLKALGGEIVCQKDALLCAAKGVSVGIALQKKLGAGLFGGEGFILQKVSGDGYAFIHAGGALVEKTLAQGEVLRLDTGCLAAMEPTVNYDIQWVGGIKSAVFGGEGLFFATLTGPGKVWVQSLPLSRLADRIFAGAKKGATGGGKDKGEGSLLGSLGDLLDGDG